VCSELQCTGSAVILTVTGGQCQTFVNGSEVTVSCQLHHVSLTCLEFMIVTRVLITNVLICFIAGLLPGSAVHPAMFHASHVCGHRELDYRRDTFLGWIA